MNKAVSIIVTIYNKEDYLDQCIHSLRQQTLSNIEIILVNDGSTDGSLNICRYHANEDGRIVVINKNNEGVVKARVDGVKSAEGE